MKPKIILTLFIIIIAVKIYSQKSAVFNYSPYFSAVIVSKIDSSVVWYQLVFGLKIKNRINEEQSGFKVVILESSHFLLELIENKSTLSVKNILSGKPEGTKIQGLFKIGFKVSDIDACIKHLSSLKVSIGHVYKDASSGKSNFLIEDPDGNLIQFYD